MHRLAPEYAEKGRAQVRAEMLQELKRDGSGSFEEKFEINARYAAFGPVVPMFTESWVAFALPESWKSEILTLTRPAMEERIRQKPGGF